MSATVTDARSVTEIARQARPAGRRLAALDTDTKDAALHAIADAIQARASEVLAANAADVVAGREAGLEPALLDRLTLDADGLDAIADAVRRIAALRDPVGEVIEGYRLPNGLDVARQRIPLGVIAVVYEARPNVTIDAAALALKSGNAIILRGSSSAMRSNVILAEIAAAAAESAGAPAHAIQLVAGGGREELSELATQDKYVDLIIPRGGEGLKRALKAVATVPMIFAASGNCHVYVDRSADLDQALEIIENAKVQRPSACNAVETLLVHRDVAAELLPRVADRLGALEVELRPDAEAEPLVSGHAAVVHAAVDSDWDEEYLALILAIKIVDDVEAAVEHVEEHGSGHSEAILARDDRAIRTFERGIGSACVYVNASTRFTDGGEYGMGAEIGNSTQKLHARGPIGLRELTSYRYLVRGDGHVRG